MPKTSLFVVSCAVTATLAALLALGVYLLAAPAAPEAEPAARVTFTPPAPGPAGPRGRAPGPGPAPGRQLTREEEAAGREFVRMQAEKDLLDPRSSVGRFRLACKYFAHHKGAWGTAHDPGGVPYLVRAVELYREENPGRWAAATRELVYGPERAVRRLPDRVVPDVVRFLEARPADARTIEAVGLLGPRARGALPVLRKVCDEQRGPVAVAAFLAVRRIEGGR